MSQKGRFGTARWLLIVVLIIAGVAMIFLPSHLWPTEVLHRDTLTEANDHSIQTELEFPEGDYEVWMTLTFWSLLAVNHPDVEVQSATGETVHVTLMFEGTERDIEDTSCRLFARFKIVDPGTYNVSIDSDPLNIGLTGSSTVFVTEERPSAYAASQWTGAILILVAILGGIVILLQDYLAKERARRAAQPAPTQYPPPVYPTYPPSQQQPYGYQQPAYGQQGYQYPGYGQYQQYPGQPQQPQGGDRSRPPDPY